MTILRNSQNTFTIAGDDLKGLHVADEMTFGELLEFVARMYCPDPPGNPCYTTRPLFLMEAGAPDGDGFAAIPAKADFDHAADEEESL
jgi:hypothetical protein